MIKCYNPKCQHERDYNGCFTDDEDTITCTKCRHKLRLGKAKIVRLPHEVGSEVGIPHSSKGPYKKTIKEKQKEFIEEKIIHLKNILHANPVNLEHIRKNGM